MIPEDRKEREDESPKRKAGRRKSPGTLTARKPSKPPRPSAGPGQQGGRPIKSKPKIIVSVGGSYEKARKEVDAEGGSPR